MYENGKKINVFGRKMAIAEIGEGEQVIVFLPGLGSPSTAVEFRGVAEFLRSRFRIIFVDPLGYGMSDRTDKARRTSDVVEELHEALSQLGLKRYILAAHSLSGLAVLEYSNRYTEEVQAVVGIDCCVPMQYEVRQMIENTAKSYEKRAKIKNSFVNKKVTKAICKMTLGSCKDYNYSKEEIELYTQLSIENCDSSVTLSEVGLFGENAASLKDKKFPPETDVLFLLSEQTEKNLKKWTEWHEAVLCGNRCRIVRLKGNHNLHLTCAKETAQNIIDFI